MQVRLGATLRSGTGKGAARAARRQRLVPAIVYGSGIDPITVVVNRKEVHRALSTEAGRNVLVELELEGSSKPILTIPREIQKESLTDEYLHIDFLAIRHDTKIHTEVPVVLEGRAPAVSKGFVIETHLTSVEIECLPANVPAHLEAPAAMLENPGDTIKAMDIELPENVTLVTDPEEVVASLSLPPAIAAAGAGEAGESEAVIGGPTAGEGSPEGGKLPAPSSQEE
ncbi:MAG: 50S ribosomal protein L25 [Acidimicrobiia bacterium]